MKRIFLTAALLILSPLICQAQSAKEANWLKAITPFYQAASALGIQAKVAIVANPQPGDSPVSMRFDKGVCEFILSVRNNPVATSIERLVRTDVARIAMVAHEYGHCLHNTAIASGALKKSSPEFAEALADAFAIAWMAQNRPADLEETVAFFKELRERFVPEDYVMSLSAVKAAESWKFSPDYSPLEHAHAIVAKR